MKIIVLEGIINNWKGDFGAAVLPLCKKTGRFLLAKRGSKITYPNQWTNFGGGSNQGETPENTARREFKEESGYKGKISKLIKSYIHKKTGYTFHNFIGLVSTEFKPPMVNKVTVDGDIEVSDYIWATYNEIISNKFPFGTLHYGIKDMFKTDRKKIINIIKRNTDAKIF
jgi:8-oxo-dGTP pyrophosphatase MutT (NUDIX family)